MLHDLNDESLNKPLDPAYTNPASSSKFTTKDYPPFSSPVPEPQAPAAPGSAGTPPPPAAHKKAGKRGKFSGCSCTTAGIVLLVLCLLGSLAFNGILAVGKLSDIKTSGDVDTSGPTYVYKLINKASTGEVTHKIAVLPIDGVISSSRGDGIGSFCTPEELRSALDFLAEDKSIVAVVLEVNSPGGGLTASDIMLHYLRDFKFRTELPIYAYFLDEACSGGYYISMAAEEIYACPTTMTGSIGVIMQMPEVSGLMDKMGVKMVTIASLNSEGKPSYKDIGSMFRTMKPDERAMLQAMITESWQGFVQVVSEGRKGKLSNKEVEKLADGRIFTAKQAQKAKIFDGICYPDELYAKINQKLHDKFPGEACAVRLTRETTFLDAFNGLGINSSLDLVNLSRTRQMPNSALPQRYFRSQYDGSVQF